MTHRLCSVLNQPLNPGGPANSMRRSRCRGTLRRRFGPEIHLGHLSRSLGRLKISLIWFETRKSGNQIVGELEQVGVVVLQRIVVSLALDRDSVLGSRQFILQA